MFDGVENFFSANKTCPERSRRSDGSSLTGGKLLFLFGILRSGLHTVSSGQCYATRESQGQEVTLHALGSIIAIRNVMAIFGSSHLDASLSQGLWKRLNFTLRGACRWNFAVADFFAPRG